MDELVIEWTDYATQEDGAAAPMYYEELVLMCIWDEIVWC